MDDDMELDPGDASGTVEPPPAALETPDGPSGMPPAPRKRGRGRPRKVTRTPEEQRILRRVQRREAALRRARELQMPGPDEVPEAVRKARAARDRQPPKRGPAPQPEPAPALPADLREQITSALKMANQAYCAFARCDCRQRERPEGYPARIGHYWDCPQSRALDEPEALALADALAGEVEAHPQWLSQWDRLKAWAPHLALAWVVVQIAAVRFTTPPMPPTPQPEPETGRTAEDGLYQYVVREDGSYGPREVTGEVTNETPDGR
ncbi:MAG: hypothetical protein KGK07_13450 [Chloroflexota bacterium]|nr:hypothetical protein [Chloroflexota bacterium]